MGTPRLAGLAEAADVLGVSKRSAGQYAKRPDFPAPLARLASGPVWDASAIEAWGAEHGLRYLGEPRIELA